VVALVVAVALIVMLLVRNSTVSQGQRWDYIILSALVYLGGLFLYVLWKIVCIPVKLDQEREATIIKLEEEKRKLNQKGMDLESQATTNEARAQSVREQERPCK
jgi:hypothetical protein